MITQTITNRFTGDTIYTAEIDYDTSENASVLLGAAVKCAVEAGADLKWADLKWAYLEGVE